MKTNKKVKWLIGLSSVAAFTGFVGILNKSNAITNAEVASSPSLNNGNAQTEQTTPNAQNPFSDDNSSSSGSESANGDYSAQNGQSSNSSDSWAGDYEGNNSNDLNNGNSAENGAQDSFGQQPPNGQNSGQSIEGPNSFEQGQEQNGEITGRAS